MTTKKPTNNPFRRMTRLKRGTAEKNQSFTMLRKNARKQEVNILLLEVAGWLSQVLSIEDYGKKVLQNDGVVTGITLCQLMNKVDAELKIKINMKAKPKSFHARENIQKFIHTALDLGVPKIKQIEVEDIVQEKNIRSVLYFILEFAEQAYLRYGVPLPEIVRAKMEIEKLQKDDSHGMMTMDFPRVTPSLEHREYIPLKNDEIDVLVANYCNENAVPVTATPAPLPLGNGQYIFPAEEPPFHIHYVALIRGTLLVRVGDGWEPFFQLIENKMKAAFASGAAYVQNIKSDDKKVDTDATIIEEDSVDVFDFDYKYEQRMEYIMNLDGLHINLDINKFVRKAYNGLTWHVHDWWTIHTEYMGTPDSYRSSIRVVFGDDDHNVIDILHTHCTKTEAFVAWRITESTFRHGNDQTHEWVGTNVFWHLKEDGNGCKLHLLHYPTFNEQAHDSTMNFWDTYVKHSLKPFIETGVGNPYPDIWMESPADWQPNSASDSCMCCDRKFTVLVRRHHCRQCGLLVCNNCSSTRKLVKRYHPTKKQRVCDTCK